MNRKTTRRALVLSLLSLLLCCSMLVGTTFAWFTDSVTSGKNTIVAGNLDIELKYSKDFTTWNTVEGASDLVDPRALWEPGRTEVVYLKLSNEGTLALKYSFAMNVANAIIGKSVEGNDIALADYLKYDIIDVTAAYANRDAARAAVESTAKALTDYTAAGTMLPGEAAKTMALVIYMPETVGNEANYRGEAIPTIELGLDLFATQLTAEEDSFGPDYDEDAVYADATYIVEGQATLADVMAEVGASDNETVLIVLNEDATWETGAGTGSNPLVGEDSAVKNLIIDAQGHTLTATGKGVGAIRMANGGALTIKNAKIVDQSVSYAENSWEYGYLEFNGNVAFQSCEIVNAISIDGQNATFVDCSFNSNKDNEYAVWVTNGKATFTRCTFTGPRGLKTHEAYGSEVENILVDSCTFNTITKKPGIALGTLNADTTVIIKNSDFINCQPGDQGKYIYETDTDVTTFNFDCSQNNEVINVATPDLEIATAAELFAFASSVNNDGNNYAGKLVVLTADIDLENVEWTPVGQTGGNGAATYFQGMFDGQGHTISNLKVSQNNTYLGGNYASGLFGFIDAAAAQIVNVNVNGASVTGTHWTGVIAGYTTGKISGCTVTNATVTCNHANSEACGDKAGVITGYVNGGVVTGNTVKDCTVTAGRDAGQVAGCAKTTYVYGNTIYNVTVTATGDCTGANIRNEEIGRIN